MQQLVPVEAKGGGAKLATRRTAIVDESVRVEAVLGDATVSVGDLASLAVNDVVVLSGELSQPSHLITGDGRRVADFSLGRLGLETSGADHQIVGIPQVIMNRAVMQIVEEKRSMSSVVSRVDLPVLNSAAEKGRPLGERLDLVEHVQVKLTVTLGEAEINVGKLFSLARTTLSP